MNRTLGARSHGRDLGKILPNLGITFHKMRTPSLPHRAAVSRTRWKCPRRPSGLSPSTLPSPRSASCWPWHVLSRLQDFLDSQKSHRKKVPSQHLVVACYRTSLLTHTVQVSPREPRSEWVPVPLARVLPKGLFCPLSQGPHGQRESPRGVCIPAP